MKAIKGRDIIDTVIAEAKISTTIEGINILTISGHTSLLEIHARALACHCECLGMNAENSQRAMLGQSMAYADDAYLDCLKKWGLVTEKYKPNI